MTSQAECRSHAALCTQLAGQEPRNRCVWMAEAEYWLRLSKERLREEAGTNSAWGKLVSRRRSWQAVCSISQSVKDFVGDRKARAHLLFRHRCSSTSPDSWRQFAHKYPSCAAIRADKAQLMAQCSRSWRG
jgi:hypothetical protein